MTEQKKTLTEIHKAHRDANWPMQNWRAWGSWFSWGSPVGLGIFIALTMISIGLFLWLIKL